MSAGGGTWGTCVIFQEKGLTLFSLKPMAGGKNRKVIKRFRPKVALGDGGQIS